MKHFTNFLIGANAAIAGMAISGTEWSINTKGFLIGLLIVVAYNAGRLFSNR